MSSLMNESGTSAELQFNNIVAVVSATSTAAVAATALVGASNQMNSKNLIMQRDKSETPAISCSDDMVSTNSAIEEETQFSDTRGGINLSLMQNSPPPHSYRHSRAYRHFKNPPQPHMCIRTTSESGEELFINVLSWTRIVIPQEPTDPIPLYGGMRVPPGSPRSPPIVFAVMANPEVLKDSGRHSKDPEERRAMVELMCDFVEAMNPGLKLVRNAIILKDRDISGELKDVWSAVQAQRDREREEQIIQQRQQHHFHSITTQQMFPRSTEAVRISEQKQINTVCTENSDKLLLGSLAEKSLNNRTVSVQSDSTNTSAAGDVTVHIKDTVKLKQPQETYEICANIASGGNDDILSDGKDQTDATNKLSATTDICDNRKVSVKTLSGPQLIIGEEKSKRKGVEHIDSPSPLSSSTVLTIETPAINNIGTSSGLTSSNHIKMNTTVSPAVSASTITKKEKLVGFLPNGCIFPRFKNYKNKEKDKDKESKSKDKTLLNALKKSKDKKSRKC
uniref:PIH1 domain-containing protein 2 n=1 Tax=Bactrocera latifrons TaxID=174628 RepID=A0A0K8WM84_BACLA